MAESKGFIYPISVIVAELDNHRLLISDTEKKLKDDFYVLYHEDFQKSVEELYQERDQLERALHLLQVMHVGDFKDD